MKRGKPDTAADFAVTFLVAIYRCQLYNGTRSDDRSNEESWADDIRAVVKENNGKLWGRHRHPSSSMQNTGSCIVLQFLASCTPFNLDGISCNLEILFLTGKARAEQPFSLTQLDICRVLCCSARAGSPEVVDSLLPKFDMESCLDDCIWCERYLALLEIPQTAPLFEKVDAIGDTKLSELGSALSNNDIVRQESAKRARSLLGLFTKSVPSRSLGQVQALHTIASHLSGNTVSQILALMPLPAPFERIRRYLDGQAIDTLLTFSSSSVRTRVPCPHHTLDMIKRMLPKDSAVVDVDHTWNSLSLEDSAPPSVFHRGLVSGHERKSDEREVKQPHHKPVSILHHLVYNTLREEWHIDHVSDLLEVVEVIISHGADLEERDCFDCNILEATEDALYVARLSLKKASPKKKGQVWDGIPGIIRRNLEDNGCRARRGSILVLEKLLGVLKKAGATSRNAPLTSDTDSDGDDIEIVSDDSEGDLDDTDSNNSGC